jgi:tetratricopeptide (TPR) repeat protein
MSVEEVLAQGRAMECGDDYAGAQASYEKVLALTEDSTCPRADIWRADALHGLGKIARLRGRYAQAEALLRRGIAHATRVHGADAPETAYLINELAMTFRYWGRFEEASDLYQRALCALTDPLDVAGVWHNLGGLEHARGDFAAAASHARRSVEIRQGLLGRDHLDVVADRAALAAILDALGEDAEAEALLRQALEVFTRALGPDHVEVAITRGNLAALLHRRGDLDQAEPMYRCALAMREKILGPDHPELAITLNNLATLCEERGDTAQAQALRARAGRLAQRVAWAEEVAQT